MAVTTPLVMRSLLVSALPTCTSVVLVVHLFIVPVSINKIVTIIGGKLLVICGAIMASIVHGVGATMRVMMPISRAVIVALTIHRLRKKRPMMELDQC